MNPERVRHLIQRQTQNPKKYVLYWMQQSQRVHYNLALNVAIQLANQENLPLVVFFGLTSDYPDANSRHYPFLLEGIREVKQDLETLGACFCLFQGSPEEAIKPLLADALIVVCDAGHQTIQREWRKTLYFHLIKHYPDLDYYQVETDLIVPVDIASDKLEYGAYTLRPKLKRSIPAFLDFDPLPDLHVKATVDCFSFASNTVPESVSNPNWTPQQVISLSEYFTGGYREAKKRLEHFIHQKLSRYEESNDPSLALTSTLSPYLHFGQIGVLEIVHSIMSASGPESQKAAFLEQVIVRRELAFNFIHFNPHYADFSHITESWAYQSMTIHEKDPRPYHYTVNDYLAFKTHDPYFNAAMKQLVLTGFMENYLRMYWAKKIIEWSSTYREAFETTLYLNNTYFLDGRDANSYAGIAWCYGRHDRAWPERPIFGKLRYMNQAGLERKFKMNDYLERIKQIEQSY